MDRGIAQAQAQGAAPLKLHVGCGHRYLEGYINIDCREEVSPDLVADAAKLGFHFASGSVDEIYACHMLEHSQFPHALMAEWAGLLKPGGILRLAVPDTQFIMAAYIHGGVSLRRLQGLLWGGQYHDLDCHWTGWDFETLAEDMRKQGFYHIEPWYPVETFPEGYDDYSYAELFNGGGIKWAMSLNVRGKRGRQR